MKTKMILRRSVLCFMLGLFACMAWPAEGFTVGNFTYAVCDNGVEVSVVDYVGTDYYVSIPSEVVYEGKSYIVTSLGDGCFRKYKLAKEFRIPSSVVSLGRECFSGTSIQYITIPSSVTSLGDACFSGCVQLCDIEIPSSVEKIGEKCFYGCYHLGSAKVFSSASLSKSCFEGCNDLYSVSVSSFVTSLEERCFSGCSSLHVVDISASVTSLGDKCFYGCSNLKSIKLPSVTSLGKSCFQSCEILESVEAPSVLSLGDYCFYRCFKLKSIKLPSAVSLGESCFKICEILESVEIPSSLSLGDYCFEDCTRLKSFIFPSSVTSIGSFCFSGTGLNEIKIPSSVTSLGVSCFSRCKSLVVADVQARIESLPGDFFSDCPKLEKIKFPSTLVKLVSHSSLYGCTSLAEIVLPSPAVVEGLPTGAGLYVPENLVDEYKGKYAGNNVYPMSEWKEWGTGIATASGRGVVAAVHNGVVTVSGLTDGEQVSFYTIDGKLIGTQRAVDGTASLPALPLASGVVIARIGNQSMKVMVK